MDLFPAFQPISLVFYSCHSQYIWPTRYFFRIFFSISWYCSYWLQLPMASALSQYRGIADRFYGYLPAWQSANCFPAINNCSLGIFEPFSYSHSRSMSSLANACHKTIAFHAFCSILIMHHVMVRSTDVPTLATCGIKVNFDKNPINLHVMRTRNGVFVQR